MGYVAGLIVVLTLLVLVLAVMGIVSYFQTGTALTAAISERKSRVSNWHLLLTLYEKLDPKERSRITFNVPSQIQMELDVSDTGLNEWFRAWIDKRKWADDSTAFELKQCEEREKELRERLKTFLPRIA